MEKDFVKAWDNCLKVIQDNINLQSFKTWFEPIKPLKLENDVLTIQVPSQFFYEWLEEHYITLLRKTIKKELGNEGRLEYSIVVDNTLSKSPVTIKVPTKNSKELKNPPIALPVNINEDNTIRNPFIIPGLKKVEVHSQLNPIYSFDNFVEGDCNRLARAAGLAIASNPGGTSFNPLFIYSKVGLGKTHLGHAIGIQIKNNFPNKTVVYVETNKFVQQYVDATRNGHHNDFIHFYQMLDTLILDDVHFLSGKEGTQNIFFDVFNHLHRSGKQIILTSDKPPVEIQNIEQRLLSRFKWGLAADLQPPDLETRIAIFEKKIYNEGIEIPHDVIEYLATNITTNIREIEGALISLIAQSTLNKKAINLALAKQVLDVCVKKSAREINIDYIQKIVCEYFNVPPEMIGSKTRKREVVQARQIAMYFSKSFTKLSLAMIGLHCGNKDHATVLHACRTVNNLMETDRQFKNYIEEIEKKIKN
ncbi:MAG: chromosomal replication initiator protein DnaA [Bacteroidales bacterium]|jgi:chromosomal replication initiator protein